MYKVISIFLLISLFLLTNHSLFSQDKKIDRLKESILTEKDPNKKIKDLYKLSSYYYDNRDIDSALKYAKLGLDFSEKNKFIDENLKFLKLLGEIRYASGKYDLSAANFKKLFIISNQYSNKKFIGISYQGLSKILWRKGKYDESVYFGTEAVKIFERINDTLNVTYTKGNLGVVYIDIGDFDRAENIYNEILIIYKKIKDTLSIANTYEKIGVIKFYNSYYPLARKYYFKAFHLYKEADKELEAAIELGNIAETYEMEKDYHRAIRKYSEAIKIERKYNYYSGLIFLYQAIGRSYLKIKNFDKAEQSLFISLKYIKKTGENRELLNIYKLLYELYESSGDYKKAYRFSLKTLSVKDSIIGSQVQNQMNEIIIKYESEKKEKENEFLRKNQILQDTNIKYQKKENRKQYFILILVLVILMFVTIVSVILYRLYRKNKRTGYILEKKNNQLNNLYKDITDSITYAGNIQKALLSSFKDVIVNFSDYFIFYEPANILSGDFYWSKKINDTIFVTVADSTGHGIPGALISILGMSLLNEIINEDFIQTDTILNNLREKIKKSLNQTGKIGEHKDGWDISILSLNINTGEAHYSGAFNSIYVISNRKSENPNEGHFTEFKADRQPVAIYHREKPFSKQYFKFEKGDIVYLFTDGYSDQLDAVKNKKFTSKRFKKLLLSISNETMKTQESMIRDTFFNWKGEFERVDDVLVLGIKI